MEEKQGTALHQAVKGRQWDRVLLQLQQGADVNVVDDKWRTPLHMALEHGAPEDIVTRLISRENINMKDAYGRRPLHLPIKSLALVTLLKNHGADVNMVGVARCTPLHLAVLHNALDDIIPSLISRENINMRDEVNRTALTHALISRRWELVPVLIQHGADINMPANFDKATSLQTAVASNAPVEIIVQLISPCNINAQLRDGSTALHLAQMQQRWEVVPILLQHKADINICCNWDTTALHQAVSHNAPADIVSQLISPQIINMRVLHRALDDKRWELVSLLLERGADVNVCNAWNKTPLHGAVLNNGPTDIVSQLISSNNINISMTIHENGWESESVLLTHGTVYNSSESSRWMISLRDNGFQHVTDDFTPLHIVMNMQRWELVPVLLKGGADVNITCTCQLKATPLHQAVLQNAPADIVRQVISSQNINMRYKDGPTALNIAIYQHKWDLALVLLDHGADVNVMDDLCYTALHRALKRKAPGNLITQLKSAQNITRQDKWGSTPLHLAVLYLGSKADIVVQMISCENINCVDNKGDTALHLAITKKRLDLVPVLIQRGSNINMQNKKGSTPLHMVISQRNWKLVRLLLEKGADVNIVDEFSRTPLHLAVENYGPVSLIILMISPININLQQQHAFNMQLQPCCTALHLACIKNFSVLIPHLLKNGADVNMVNAFRDTPLHLAVCYGAPADTVNQLISPQNINTPCRQKFTHLHTVMQKRRWDLVPLLLHHGADVNMVDDWMCTPLHKAIHYRAPADIVIRVISAENINVKNVSGETPLLCTVIDKVWELVPILLEHGADINVLGPFNCTPLHLAIHANTPRDIIVRLISPENVNKQDNNGQTALFLLASCRLYQLVPVMLQHGADPSMVLGYQRRLSLKDLCITTIRSHMTLKTDESLEQLGLPRCLMPEMKMFGLAQQFVAWWKELMDVTDSDETQ